MGQRADEARRLDKMGRWRERSEDEMGGVVH